MKRFESIAALAAFVFASCLLAAPTFAKETAQNKKPVSVLVEELYFSDHSTRQSAYGELLKKEFTEPEIKVLLNAFVETIDQDAAQKIMNILWRLEPDKRKILYSTYNRALVSQKYLPARLLAAFPENNHPREGVEFLLEKFNTATLAERKIIIQALGYSKNISYEDLRPVFLSEDETGRQLVYSLMKFHNKEILEALFTRTMQQSQMGGVYAKKLLTSLISSSFIESYDFITSKLDSANKFEKIRMLHILTNVHETNSDLIARMMELAGDDANAAELEKTMATNWLVRRHRWSFERNGPKDLAVFEKYRTSKSAALRQGAIYSACAGSKQFYDLLYQHLQEFQDYKPVLECLSRFDFDEETARRFYPIAIRSGESSFLISNLLKKPRHKSIAGELLQEAANGGNEKLRESSFYMYLRLLQPEAQNILQQAGELAPYINHFDPKIAAMAMEKRLSWHHKLPITQSEIDVLLRWYRQRDLHNNERLLYLALEGLNLVDYFTPDDIRELVALYSSGKAGASSGALNALSKMLKHSQPYLVKLITGNLEKDAILYWTLHKGGEISKTLFELSDQGKFSSEYFYKVVLKTSPGQKEGDILLSRLKTHPPQPYVVLAFSMGEKAKSQKDLWFSLYNTYSKKDLSDHDNMLIFSAAAYHLHSDGQEASPEYMAAVYYLHVFRESHLMFDPYSGQLSKMLDTLKNPQGVQKNFSLLAHPNEWVRAYALKAAAESLTVSPGLSPVKTRLSDQNIKDLLALQKSQNIEIRGYAILLLFRFQDQILQHNVMNNFSDLAYAAGLKKDGFAHGFLKEFDARPDKQLSLLERCLDEQNTVSGCFNLVEYSLDNGVDIAPLIFKLQALTTNESYTIKNHAVEILCRAASQHKDRVFPFLKNLLKPSDKFPEDSNELTLKIAVLKNIHYLKGDAKELMGDFILLYKALDRVSEHIERPFEYVPGSRGQLYKLYELKTELSGALLLYPENKPYTRKSLYFIWKNTDTNHLPNYFWQAYRKHPVKLLEANE